MQEVMLKRTECSKTYQDGDKHVVEIFAAPIHYLDEQGTWQDQDLNWEIEDGFGKKAKKTKHHLRLISDGTLRFGFDKGIYVDYSLPGDLTISGNEALLTDAWPKTDLKYTNRPRGVKGDIILKESGHPASFGFPLSAVGCTPEQIGNALIFKVGEETIGQIPAPFAEDANGVRGDVALTCVDGVITFTPDAGWLVTATYPVIIDPTTETIQPDDAAGKDAPVLSGSPTQNNGTSGDLYAQQGSRNSFVQFDISTIPVQTGISDAQLSLYLYSHYASAHNYETSPLTEAWEEMQATWNNRITDTAWATAGGSFDATKKVTTASPLAVGFVDIDGTAIVKEWHLGTLSNYGFFVTSSYAAAYDSFYSSDYAVDIAKRPKLAITYTAKPTITITTLNGANVSNPSAVSDEVSGMTLSGVYSSVDAVDMAEKQHQIYDEDDNLIWDSDWVAEAASPTDTVSATVPDTPLTYGTVYYWRWRAKDANGGYSDWSSSGYFQSTLSAPANLVAVDDAAGAEIGLAWDAHLGENIAGYYVYRKKAAESTYVKISGLLTTNSYDDEIAASGQEYNYKVSAVADDGHESAQSAAATDTVTFTKWMINNTEVKLSGPVRIASPRRASSRIKTDGTYEVQDLGLLPKKAQFTLRYESFAGLETLLALFTAGLVISYRDPQGRTFKGKLISDITDNQWDKLPLAKFYGDLSFEAVEVTA